MLDLLYLNQEGDMRLSDEDKEALNAMIESRGWKIFGFIIEKERDRLMDKLLLRSTEMEQMKEITCQIRTFDDSRKLPNTILRNRTQEG